jgi:hypothetical protein
MQAVCLNSSACCVVIPSKFAQMAQLGNPFHEISNPSAKHVEDVIIVNERIINGVMQKPS